MDMYNKYVSLDQIIDFDCQIDSDPYLIQYKKNPFVREVCRAGLFLCTKLEELKCPESLITKIQKSVGMASMQFGSLDSKDFSKDPWEMHAYALQAYINNTLIINDGDHDFASKYDVC